MSDTKLESVKTCNVCGITKALSLCLTTHNVCKNCNNEKRRNKYKENQEHRLKLIKLATNFKKQKLEIRKQEKEEYQQLIGIDNKVCKYCNVIKPKNRFRYNRLKCRDCERDEPLQKLKRLVRSRIHIALKNKQKHTIEYLGCSIDNYVEWLLFEDNNYTLENRGKDWHIDHVIPLSKFNLNDENEQLVAFNWRNTMPLSPTENLQKNNKVIPQQIKTHLEKLTKYHKDNNIDFPQTYIDLFAKHLDAGSPLEPI